MPDLLQDWESSYSGKLRLWVLEQQRTAMRIYLFYIQLPVLYADFPEQSSITSPVEKSCSVSHFPNIQGRAHDTNGCLCPASPSGKLILMLCLMALLGFHRGLDHQCDQRVGDLCSGKDSCFPRVVIDGSYLDDVCSNDSDALKTVENGQEFPSGPPSNFCSPRG